MKPFTLDIPRQELLSANQRLHWQSKARRVSTLRTRSRLLSRGRKPFPTPLMIDVYVWKPRGGRYDPANLYPSAKPVIDGFVDAGLLPDDDFKNVDGPHLHHGGVDKEIPAGFTRFIFKFKQVK